MKNNDLSLSSVSVILGKLGGSLKRYLGLIFFVLLAAIYALLVLRINMLSNIEPSQLTPQQSTKQPHINPEVVKKIQSLQDNSVNVQSLFDGARQNPFQE